MMKSSLILTFFVCVIYSKVNAQTVYVSESGKKYHAKNCQLAKTGKKGITISQALKDGYEACKNCKADKIRVANKKENIELESKNKK